MESIPISLASSAKLFSWLPRTICLSDSMKNESDEFVWIFKTAYNSTWVGSSKLILVLTKSFSDLALLIHAINVIKKNKTSVLTNRNENLEYFIDY